MERLQLVPDQELGFIAKGRRAGPVLRDPTPISRALGTRLAAAGR